VSGASLIAWAALGGVALALAVAMLRLFAGPTLYDRLLATNAIALKSAIAAAALAVLFAQSQWIDAAFALLFALTVANVAIVKFFRAHSFQPPLGGPRESAR